MSKYISKLSEKCQHKTQLLRTPKDFHPDKKNTKRSWN